MDRIAVVCIVLLATAGLVQGVDVRQLVEALPEDCQQLVIQVYIGCRTEFEAAAAAVGVSFPPPEDAVIDQQRVEEYALSDTSITDKCCLAACNLSKIGCGCHEDVYNGLVSALTGNVDFAITVFERVRLSCSNRENPFNFKTTLRGFKDESGTEICLKDPGITC